MVSLYTRNFHRLSGLLNLNNKLNLLITVVVSFLLISCGGGGGGGGALVQNNPQPTTPTYSYTSIDALAESGGSPNKILGRSTMWRSHTDCYSPECSSTWYRWNSVKTDGISVTYSTPDSFGVQSLTI